MAIITLFYLQTYIENVMHSFVHSFIHSFIHSLTLSVVVLNDRSIDFSKTSFPQSASKCF